jgi:NADH:ubiquinone oxidoreductase subunit F (NADH-binding)
MVESPLTKYITNGNRPLSCEAYESLGGYAAFKKALSAMTPAQVRETVTESNLRGRGGRGISYRHKVGCGSHEAGRGHPEVCCC